MAKRCPNCGNQVEENAVFCGNCGTSIAGDATPVQPVASGNGLLQERNVVLAIVLSLVTCGIYAIYWFIVMTDEANKVSGDNKTSGAMAFVFSLITCGIYELYWYYQMGKKLYTAGKTYGKDIADNSVIYLILGIFGLGIVSYALIQSDLNKFSN
jgi:hypothetical protein